MTSTTTFYEILGLPDAPHDVSSISSQSLKSAYRRALLQNHPDKAHTSIKQSLSSSPASYSVDQISEAFYILSNPKSKAQYDKELRLRRSTLDGHEGQTFRTGVETLDLDDLNFDEAQGIWYKSCRCGDARGFLIRESELEQAADDGEISIGCKGCSLWIKVLFGVVDASLKDADAGLDMSENGHEEATVTRSA